MHCDVAELHVIVQHFPLQFVGWNTKCLITGFVSYLWLQCFDAVGWAAGRASGL